MTKYICFAVESRGHWDLAFPDLVKTENSKQITLLK